MPGPAPSLREILHGAAAGAEEDDRQPAPAPSLREILHGAGAAPAPTPVPASPLAPAATKTSGIGWTDPLRIAAGQLAPAISEVSSPAMWREARAKIPALPPEFRQKEYAKLATFEKERKVLEKGAAKVSGELSIEGLAPEAAALRGAGGAGAEAARMARTAGRMATASGSWALGKLEDLDVWGRRQVANTLAPDVSGATERGVPVDPGTWGEAQRRLREAAATPNAGLRHEGAWWLTRGFDLFGRGAEAAGKALYYLDAPGALIDPEGHKPRVATAPAPSWLNPLAKEGQRVGAPAQLQPPPPGSAQAVSDFALGMGISPTTYLSFLGGTTRAKNAAAAARRAGFPAAAPWLEQLLTKEFGPETIEKARNILRSAGATEPEIGRMIGASGEFLGARQLSVGVPFTSLETQPIPALTGAVGRMLGKTGTALEHPVGHALQAAGAALGGRPVQGSLPLAILLGAATPRRFASDFQARMRGMDALEREAFMKDAEQALHGAPVEVKRAFGIGPKRGVPDTRAIADLIDLHLDPAYDLIPMRNLPGGTSAGNMLRYSQLSTEARSRLLFTGPMSQQAKAFGPQPNYPLGVANVIDYRGEPHAVVTNLARPWRISTTPEQKLLAGNLEDLFRRWAAKLQGAGALGPGQLAYNPATGRYIPRTFSLERGPFTELREFGPNPYARGSSAFRSRVNEGLGISRGQMEEQLGQAGAGRRMRQDLDLPEVLVRYAGQQSKAQARAAGYDWLIRNYGTPIPQGTGWTEIPLAKGIPGPKWKRSQTAWVPNDTLNMIERTFDPTYTAPSRFMRNALGMGTSWPGRFAVGGMEAAEKVGQAFKTNVLTRWPGFHVLNTPQDVGQMLGVGQVRPDELARGMEKFQQAKAGMPVSVGGRMQPGPTVVRELQRAGLATEALGQADVALGHRGDVARLRRAIAPEYGTTIPERAVAALARATLPPSMRSTRTLGERYQQAWRPLAEGGAALALMDKGHPLAEASHFARQGMIDYPAMGPVRNVISWGMPFGKFFSTAPGVVAQAATRAPASVLAPGRILGTAVTPEAPDYAQQRGPLAPATGLAQAVSRVAGAEWPRGLPAVQLRRWDWAPDIMSNFEHGEQMAQQLSPFLQGVVEAGKGMNLQTKQPIETRGGQFARNFLAPFRQGTPGVPLSLQTGSGAAKGLISQRLAPYLIPPLAGLPLNYYLWKAAGGEIPGSTASQSYLYEARPYAGAFDPRIQWALQALNWATRNPLYAVPPSTELSNVFYGPTVAAGKQGLKDIGTRRKEHQTEIDAARARLSRMP